MIDIELDEALGILRCVSSGPSTFKEVEAFSRKAALLQERARHRREVCLILVDAADASVATKQAAEHFEQQSAARFRPGDRTAIIMKSAIGKLQAQRMTAPDATAYFTNEPEALAWLLAEPAAS